MLSSLQISIVLVVVAIIASLIGLVYEERTNRKIRDRLFARRQEKLSTDEKLREVEALFASGQNGISNCVKGFAQLSVSGVRLENSFIADLATVGLLLEAPTSIIRGEELSACARNETLRNKIINDLTLIRTSLNSDNFQGTYLGIASLTYDLVARGGEIGEFDEVAAVKKFLDSLSECISHIRNDNLSEARREMRTWYIAWRKYGLPDAMPQSILPKHLFPLAMLSVQCVLDMYGDTLEWIDRHQVEDVVDTPLQVLELTRTAFSRSADYTPPNELFIRTVNWEKKAIRVLG